MHDKPATDLPLRKKLAFAFVVVSGLAVATYCAWCVAWSYVFYQHVKNQQRGWMGVVHQPHATLGYAAIPGSEGQQTFPIGPNLAIRYDENGFRVPPGAEISSAAHGPCILTLGCSFTFGDACPAEDTFAWRLAAHMHGTVLNAGKCSYGLAHMVLLARELVSRHKPDLVVAQFSPWLLERAMSYYLPAYYGTIPGPYFIERADGGLAIQPPVFAWDARDFGYYRETPKSLRDFVSFASTAAVPLRIHDDLGRCAAEFGRVTGIVFAPCKDSAKVAQAGYAELLRLCQAEHAQLLIVVIGFDAEPVQVPECLMALGVPVVRADEALIDKLPHKDDSSYRQAYATWRGDPPQLVDLHPNSQAHAIIAQAIVARLDGQPRDDSSMASGSSDVVR